MPDTLTDREPLERCPHCGLTYRRGKAEAAWCRTCPEGAAAQPPDVQRFWHIANTDYDRAEADYYEQR